MPAARGEKKRRETGIEDRTGISARRQQTLHYRGMALRGRPHQRGLTSAGQAGVHIGATGNQDAHQRLARTLTGLDLSAGKLPESSEDLAPRSPRQ